MDKTTSLEIGGSDPATTEGDEPPSLSPRGYQTEMLEAGLKVRQDSDIPSLNACVLIYRLEKHYCRCTIDSGLGDAFRC